MNAARNLESYINNERAEFIEFINLKNHKISCLPWQEFRVIEKKGIYLRFPYKSELLCEKDVHKTYMELRGIYKPQRENFFEFLTNQNLKDDYVDFESQYYRVAMIEWLKKNDLVFMLKELQQ